MKLTRTLIEKHIEANTWLNEFETLLSEIETNIESEPDISIESCKSLLEQIAKNILLRLDTSHDVRASNNKEAHVLLREAKEQLVNKAIENEEAILQRFSSVVQVINEIRNERGDISHGKHLPKKIRSSMHLANSLVAFTDGFASYLLYLFFSIDLSYQEPIQYEDNPDFNLYLDEVNPLAIIVYSKALFDQDPIVYEEELTSYQLMQDSDNY